MSSIFSTAWPHLPSNICPADRQDSSLNLLKERMVLSSENPSCPPNTNTTLLAVPARSPALGEGSLAVVRVLQDLPGVSSRISVESSLVYFPPGSCPPPVTSRTVSPLSLVK